MSWQTRLLLHIPLVPMPSRWCFYHAADLHLDTPFSGLEQIAPEIAEHLREASLQAFDDLIQRVLDDGAAFLLIAGDVYDGAQRGMRAQFRVRDGFKRLADAGIPVMMIHGNHDPLDGWSGIRNWPDGVHIYGASAVESIRVERDGETLATVHGISYVTARCTENLARRFPHPESQGLHIALLHCNVEGNTDHESYAPCTLDDLKASRMDYWALGHVHLRQVLHERSPWVVYAGNLQGRSPKPSERGEKGALRISVVDGVIQEPEFVALDRARFVAIDVDVTHADDLEAVRQQLLERGSELANEHAGRALLVRANLTGRSELYSDLLRPDTLPALVRTLRDEFADASPPIWWESVRNEVRAPIDRDALAAGSDFTAELIHDVERVKASDAMLRELFATTDKLLVLSGVSCSSSEQEQLLAEAEMLAIQLLRDAVEG